LQHRLNGHADIARPRENDKIVNNMIAKPWLAFNTKDLAPRRMDVIAGHHTETQDIMVCVLAKAIRLTESGFVPVLGGVIPAIRWQIRQDTNRSGLSSWSHE
jgi:hypothetical protein